MTTMATTTATGVLEVRLLGGFAVAVDGRAVPSTTWRSKRVAGLVKLLALEPSHRLHREQVLDALWPELDPEAADNNLRYTLHEARKRLGEAGVERTAFLLREAESLVLGPADALAVDVDTFEQAAALAWRSDDPAITAAALERYAGDLLPEDVYEEWTESRRAALRAAYLALLRRLGDLHLKRGEGAAAIATLERLVATESTDEAVQVRLMKLLARTGQRKRALAQYDQLVRVLEREVSAVPEAATTRLRDDIAAGRYPAPRPAPTAATSPMTPTASPQVSLPAPLDALIGREREVAEVGQLLATARLVTLTGPGGVGKTRLALAVAHEAVASFPDGATFVDLSPLRDPSLVLPTIGQVVGAREEPGVALVVALQALLGRGKVLLVLDNFEQVVEAAPEVAELLIACPGLKVLATSRVRLRLRGEREYPVGPLAMPESTVRSLAPRSVAALLASPAVALFVERAQVAKPSFAVTKDNAQDIAAICHRLDGLPLALELAAAWAKLLPPAAMLTRLQTGRLALTGGARDLPERQQTIRTTISWSYDLLTPEQQRLFRRLAVFVGGWTIEAAEAVGTGPEDGEIDVLASLRALVDHSLVVEREQPDGEPRFMMLETIREFGLEQLGASDEEGAVRDAHAAYFLAVAEAAAPELERAEQLAWYRRLEAEHPNVRGAIAWLQARNDAEAILRFGAALWLFWFGYHAEEGLRWLGEALKNTVRADPLVRAAALHGAGNLARARDDPKQGQVYHKEELALRRTIGDEAGIGKTLLPLGVEAFEQEEFARAETLLVESAERVRVSGDPWALCIAVKCLGDVALVRGDLERAQAFFAQALEIARKTGDQSNIASVRSGQGHAALAAGDARTAATLFAESLALDREFGCSSDTAIYLGNLVWAEIELGDLDRAEALLEEALTLKVDAMSSGDRSWLLLNSARVARLRGDQPRAVNHYSEALHLAEEVQSNRRQHTAECLDEIAAFAAWIGNDTQAVTLWGAADHLRETIGLWWRRNPDIEQAIGRTRKAMGELAFAEAWETGHMIEANHALAVAQEILRTAEVKAGKIATMARAHQ
jgi:predicted ATPase/DNA-binding SARP family transcriptional activator